MIFSFFKSHSLLILVVIKNIGISLLCCITTVIQLPPHCSSILSLFSKITGVCISQKLGGTGKLERERGEGEWWRGNTYSFRENGKNIAKAGMQLAVIQQSSSSASPTVQCCSEHLDPGGTGIMQFKQTASMGSVLCSNYQVISCSLDIVERRHCSEVRSVGVYQCCLLVFAW